MMDLTLREDKEIIENIYPEYQHGFMNARYDQQVRTGHQSYSERLLERARTGAGVCVCVCGDSYIEEYLFRRVGLK